MNRIDALDQLRNEVLAVIEGKRDYIEAVTVGQPDGVGKKEWQRQVEEMLVDMHLDAIDVTVDGSVESGRCLKKAHLIQSWT